MRFDFEAGVGTGWTNGGGGARSFTWHSGPTPSSTDYSGCSPRCTGPPSGHGGGGSYLYTEADGVPEGDVFRLTYNGSACTDESVLIARVDLAYHMHDGAPGWRK